MKSNRFFQLAVSFMLALAITISLVALVACEDATKPSGTYEGRSGSYTFEGDKYTLEIKAAGMKVEGIFEVEKKSKDGIKWSEIVFTDSKGNKRPSGYEIKGDTLILAGSTFTKKR